MMVRCADCRGDGWNADRTDACRACARQAQYQWLLVQAVRENRHPVRPNTQTAPRRTAPARAMEANHAVR